MFFRSLFIFTYLEGRVTQKEIFNLLFHSPNAHHSQEWAGLKPAAQNTILIPHMLDKHPSTGGLTSCLQVGVCVCVCAVYHIAPSQCLFFYQKCKIPFQFWKLLFGYITVLGYLTKLSHQLFFFSHLFHFPPNCKLWIYRFQISLRSEKHYNR